MLAIASVAIAFVVGEIAYRFYLGHRQRADLERVERGAGTTRVDTCHLGDIIRLSRVPDLFYELKPNLEGRFCGKKLTTNAFGMRMSGEPALSKPAHVRRVVALGDSYLFGQGVNDGEGFLEVLQSRELSLGRPTETLNFGVPGYNAWMEWVVLSTRARHFDPDVVLLAVTGNDWDLPNFMLSRARREVARSVLLGAVFDLFREPPELVGTPKSRVYEDHFLASTEEVPAPMRHMVGFESYRRALSNVVRLAHEAKAKVVLFSDCIGEGAPGTKTCGFPFAPGEYERIRREVYEHEDVTVCSWFLPQTLLIPGDGHPTPEGHASLASQLAECMERHGLLAR